MEPIDLCGSSSASSGGTSGTASRLAGEHVRRRRTRPATVDPDKERLWSVPVLLDFSEPDEAPLATEAKKPRATKSENKPQGKPLPKPEEPEEQQENPLAITPHVQPAIIQSSLESMTDTLSPLSPPAVVVKPGGWKPLKKKEPSAASSTEPCKVSSFFCKARPEVVIKLVQEVVSEQEKAPAAKKSWRAKMSPVKEPLKPVEQMVKKDEPLIVEEKVAVEEKPSWAKLLDDQAVVGEHRKSGIVAKGLMDQALVPEALRKITMNKVATYTRELTHEPVRNDIDPALQAALRQSAALKETEDKLVDMPFVIEVAAKLIEQDLTGEMTHKPLAFKISNKTNFGNIKTMYCNTRRISSRGLLLTHKDVPLFDSVTVSASGLEPEEMSTKLRLVLYDKELFERMKAEQQRAKAAAIEILKEHVHEAIDVSAYMQENDSEDEAEGRANSSDGLFTIKVVAGKKTCESFRIAPASSLAELLDLFLAKYPETPKDKARFIFDGDVLPLNKTIVDAELEDGDQLELRT